MAEIKSTQNSFNLVGTLHIVEPTEQKKFGSFKIDQINAKGNWQSSTATLSVNCGPSYGTIYASLTGGHSLTSDSLAWFSPVDADGKFIKDADKIEVKFSERESFDMKKVSSYEGYVLGLGLSQTKRYAFAEDFIKAIKENFKDGDTVRILGNLEYYRNPEDGTITINKVIRSIYKSETKEENFSATFEMQVLADEYTTTGEPDRTRKTFPLFFKVASYIYRIGENIYKKVGCYPIKILYDYSKIDPNNEAGKRNFANIIKKFKVDKGQVSLITICGKFVEGAEQKEVKIEDYPQQTREAYELGLITDEQLKGIAGTQQRYKDMFFTEFKVRDVQVEDEEGTKTIVVLAIEPNKYSSKDIVMVEDLVPIETVSSSAEQQAMLKENQAMANILSEDDEDANDEFLSNLFNQ